jgi:hypothetical protein
MAPLNVSGGTRNQNFRNAINSSQQIGTKISSGAFGSVYRLSDPRFVMKVMMIDNGNSNNTSDNLKIFLNEVRVGSIPGIQSVGPKIYAWKLIRRPDGRVYSGRYIMDNLGSFDSFSDYTDKYFKNSCPPLGHPLYTKLRKTLEKFWRITKGYHGDLNPSNIAVIHENGEVRKVRIIDFGSHKKFKTNVNSTTCFNDFVKIIDKQFYNKHKKAQVHKKKYFPPGSTIRIVYPKRGQPIRPNTSMLRGITTNTKLVNKKYSNSIMSKINPMNNNTQIKNYLNRLKYINTKLANNKNKLKLMPNSYYKYFFMSPRVFKKFKEEL